MVYSKAKVVLISISHFSQTVIEDCHGIEIFPETDFRLQFEHDSTSGVIQSMVVKQDHVFDVNQLKLDVNPIVCYAGNRTEGNFMCIALHCNFSLRFSKAYSRKVLRTTCMSNLGFARKIRKGGRIMRKCFED